MTKRTIVIIVLILIIFSSALYIVEGSVEGLRQVFKETFYDAKSKYSPTVFNLEVQLVADTQKPSEERPPELSSTPRGKFTPSTKPIPPVRSAP